MMNRMNFLSPLFLSLAAFFVSIKPAPTNLFLLLAVVTAIALPQHRQALRAHLASAPGLAAIALFLGLCATQLYSASTWAQADEYLWKYARLAYIPFVAAAMLNAQHKQQVLLAFVAGMLLTLALSFGNAWVPGFCNALHIRDCGPPENPFIFKQHITHGFFMALAAGLMAHWAYTQRGTARGVAWAVLSALAFYNVMFMMEGRTAWVIVLVFVAVLLARKLGYARAAALAVLLGVPVLWWLVRHVDHFPMLVQALDEYREWQATGVAPGRSGMRLTYYSHAIAAMVQHPWFGHGLGATRDALNLAPLEPKIYALNNPHNQFLLFGVQAGLVGLAAYAVFYGLLFKATSQTPALALPGQCFLLAFAVGNCFNSFHFDMSEAVLFVIACAVFCFRSARS
ncbi:MAG TPA: O-antigen ligase family protein [Limnobacter sp.]|uniref:O-antigen ligase family protein n=1 Tax=Limnobacter sp. TaxID=2003368 RepID=UPI002ED83D3D